MPFFAFLQLASVVCREKVKYVPSKEDVIKMIMAADPGTKDYLLTIRKTIARLGEINRLAWPDINLAERYVTLYTRKKKGGNLTPRKVPMTDRLYQVLSHNAVGLRLYYDAPSRPSRFGSEIVPDPMQDLYLHSAGSTYFLNDVVPAGAVKYKDSAGVNFNNGNPWKEIGTWSGTLDYSSERSGSETKWEMD